MLERGIDLAPGLRCGKCGKTSCSGTFVSGHCNHGHIVWQSQHTKSLKAPRSRPAAQPRQRKKTSAPEPWCGQRDVSRLTFNEASEPRTGNSHEVAWATLVTLSRSTQPCTTSSGTITLLYLHTTGHARMVAGPQQAQSTYCTVASLSKNRCRAETTLCERRHDQDAVRRQQVADPWNSIMDEWPA
mgnify:CR=1 FL=1